MIAETKNTKSFYNTEIPQDWEIVKVLNFRKVYTGNTPITSESDNYDGGFLFVSPGDLNEAKYIDKTEKTLSEKGFSTSRKFPKGSVLFTCIGSTIGKSGIASVDLTANQQINAIVVNNMNSNEYLYYQLEMNVNRIKLIAGEQAVPIINKSQFETIKLPKAPLPEQKAIAQVLSTADAAINTTEKLIAQKELRKKWLMQQLLTGKKRLKGFGGEWKEMHLGDLGVSFNGLTGKTKENFGSGFPFITYMNVFSNSRTDISQVDHVNIEENENQNSVKYGDFFFTVSSETPNEVGMASVLLDEVENLYLNSFCFGFRLFDFETLSPIYAQFLFRFQSFREAMCLLAQGSTRFNISKTGVKQILLTLPHIEEQTAIAQVLQAADKEISLLKTKAEKLRDQKKGLMQVLLTGKVRLKINERK
jgi:type I restriction enzyme S subunit